MSAPIGTPRRERIGRFLPAPLAGTVLLLVALILLTPVLLSTGQPAAGSLLSEPELIVDRAPGENVTHVYLRGVGASTRYAGMVIQVAGNFSWAGRFPAAPLAWMTAVNGTEVLSVSVTTTLDPVALNVSAIYEVAGSRALYVGEIALSFGTGPSGPTVFAAAATPGLAVAPSTPALDLPLIVPLVVAGAAP